VAAALFDSVVPGFSYAWQAANVQATLNALNEVTHVNIVSAPSLMVVDNKTATLQIGDQVPIITQSANGVLTPGSPIVNSVTYRDTGVILSITPHINDNGRVLLDVQQEVSNVADTTSSKIDSPTIKQRKVKTIVMVNDNESLALGGIIQTQTSVGHTQIPILGDISFLGNAFKSKSDSASKTELIVLITPHIVRNPADARAITAEYRRNLNVYMPPPRSIKHTADGVARRVLQ
jgi:general secretion pathway protein D